MCPLYASIGEPGSPRLAHGAFGRRPEFTKAGTDYTVGTKEFMRHIRNNSVEFHTHDEDVRQRRRDDKILDGSLEPGRRGVEPVATAQLVRS